MKNSELAVSRFKESFSCSQSVLSAFGPHYGMNEESAFKVSGAFGGGMARMGLTCGCVTGAMMVIGLKYGKTKAQDEQAKDKTYSLTKEFVNKFKSRNGSIVCRELLGYDISTSDGMKIIKEKKLIDTLCPKLVKDAAEILEEIL
jgi:C_GCAxxG_C_C family probable redox protein